jgi:hypothetical protein
MIRAIPAKNMKNSLRLLLALFPLLSGCPVFEIAYQVYYDGNGNTDGYPPSDSRLYNSGDYATVLERPPDLKKGALEFLGWQQVGNDTPLQAGDRVRVSGDIFLYAWWKDDPAVFPYTFIDDPSGGVIITNYSRYSGGLSIVIPELLDAKPVVGIGEGAFAGAYLDAITLPPQLEFIGNKAFVGNWLNTVKIPDSVKSIGKLAFQNVGLESLSVGSGLESIGDYAFDSNRLRAVFLPSGVLTIGEGAFADNSLETIEIGDHVAIHNDTAMGIHGAAFRRYYTEKESKAGVYLYKNGSWEGPFGR